MPKQKKLNYKLNWHNCNTCNHGYEKCGRICLALRVALEHEAMRDRPVSEVMTANPVCVHESDSAAAALSVMAVSGYRHVPVVDLDDKIVGIVSPQRVTAFLRKYFTDR